MAAKILKNIYRLLDCTLTDTFRFGNECHRILLLRFFRKYTIRLGTREQLFNHLQTNEDHHEKHKEIRHKRCETN